MPSAKTIDDAGLKVGDRVQLSDGGEPMHVAAMSPNMAFCNWIDGEGQVRQATFAKRRLVVLSSAHAQSPGAGA